MGFTFFILEDDRACRQILSSIIEDEGLGEVTGEMADGHGNVVGAVLHHQPDVLLVDLLMPGKDGVEVVESLRERSFHGKIVMISQVEKKEMVAQAYAAGIDFYINKPINRIEVISVIRGVTERLKMERSLEQVRESMAALEEIESLRKQTSQAIDSPLLDQETIKERTREVLADLGLIGEPGSHDLIQIILFLNTVPDIDKYLGEFRHLKELYQAVQEKYRREEKKVDVRAIEQRVRRAIKHAMDHVAALGIEDYNNPSFERYGPKFFDFNELRLKMKELEKEQVAPTKTRVNIKQFINALYWEIRK